VLVKISNKRGLAGNRKTTMNKELSKPQKILNYQKKPEYSIFNLRILDENSEVYSGIGDFANFYDF